MMTTRACSFAGVDSGDLPDEKLSEDAHQAATYDLLMREVARARTFEAQPDIALLKSRR
jgi:hypothetical protein